MVHQIISTKYRFRKINLPALLLTWLPLCFLLVLYSLEIRAARKQFDFQYTVSSYSKADYAGGNQNWDICTDSLGKVYIANNAGLLVIDGSKMRLFELPGKTIVRSVAFYRGRIYTGSFQEFGYWVPSSEGMEYHSLVNLIPPETFHNDEIWKIVNHRGKIFFQSFGHIFCYDGKTISMPELPGSVLFLLQSANRLFVQKINGGLYEIIDLKLVEIAGSEIFKQTEIKTIMEYPGNRFIIGTSSEGLFLFNDKNFIPWETNISDNLKNYKLNNGIKINNNFAFGTILKGIYIIDENGKLLHHLHTGNAIQNNTVLSLETDNHGNLWVGMDKGFDFVWLQSPIEKYIDPELGAAYTAVFYNDCLYAGTNRGIFCFAPEPAGRFSQPYLINNSQGQVWMLKVIDGYLYAGLNNGTYVLENNILKQVGSHNGGYNMCSVTQNGKEFYLQSTYNDIVVYEKTGKIWKESYIMQGFTAPCHFLETDYLGNLLLGHSITGLYKIQPDAFYKSAVNIIKLGTEQGIDPAMNKFFKVDNRILLPVNKSLYQWDALKNMAIPYDDLNSQLGDFSQAINIVPVNDDKYWFICRNETGMFEVRFGNAKLLYRIIPKMYGIQMVDNYENIVSLNDSLHLICLEDGFALLNIYRLNQVAEVLAPPVLREAIFSKNDKDKITFSSMTKHFNLPRKYNNFYISFASADISGRKKFYQYMLDGIETNWSDWTDRTEVSYLRLPPGDYAFQVRSMDIKGIVTPPLHLKFSIEKPWYLTNIALFAYVFTLAIMMLLIRINYKRRKWKQQEKFLKQENEKIRIAKEKAEKEIIKLANEKLHTEISLKNMQLAKNAMSISRKNEVLNDIKNEFEILKKELGYRLPAKYYENIERLIDRNLDNDKEWEQFEHHFDQAYHDFFKRLKNQYPELTPSDLRLCAYLRLNLTTKEIAPMLSITTRGVEEKRYRLRKKLNLNTEQGLTDFIMQF